MNTVTLTGCTATPLGNYLKALGVFRLICDQADPLATGRWAGETFVLETCLSDEDIALFFLLRYSPTPIVAPWNAGSGFYPKDNKDGINAIAGSSDDRFAAYRDSIAICRNMDEVAAGKSEDDEDERRTAILRHCRNRLDDRAVEWLDAAVGISADGSRSFAPVLGTGGNEGRLDYTNNFMSRIAALLVSPDPATPIRELLDNSLFASRTTSLQAGAAGQYDPGRAGGANQGPGIFHESSTNPWDLVLTIEGAVAWASGLYRRQGTGYRKILCSPFTVGATHVGYGSASAGDDARGEIWTPLWRGPVRYAELKNLLREGRASVDGRPAKNALEFAEAACSLGVDRGIERFVRYSLLKRRGDSYVALPVGTFAAGYRSEADRIRQFQAFFEPFMERLSWGKMPRGTEELRRGVESAVYNVLLHGGKRRIRDLMAALGRMFRRIATTSDSNLPYRGLNAADWLISCGFDEEVNVEVRLAAGLASINTYGVGSIADNVSRAHKMFAWTGGNLSARMVSVLERRLQVARAADNNENPLGGACPLNPGDVTSFIEEAVDDTLIEDLLFAFVTFDWSNFQISAPNLPAASREVLPVYAVLKHLFLPAKINRGPEPSLRADPRILSLLKAGSIRDAASVAIQRLRIAELRPLDVDYAGGVDGNRLAASLLIPVRAGFTLGKGIFHEDKENL